MSISYSATIEPSIIEIRFAYSGKLVYVKKKTGDTVKQWEVIASLDRKILQAQLDRQLADYEKVRAEFELFTIKYGGDNDDTTKFLRQQKQPTLNTSVKDVEIAKYQLDQADLISPINGIILNINGLVAGLNVTPSNSVVQILQTDALVISFEIDQKDLEYVTSPTEVVFSVPEHKNYYEGITSIPFYGKHGIFSVTATLKESTGLISGMNGKITIKPHIKTST